MSKHRSPRVLLFDIETTNILARTWGVGEVNIGINQIYKDWSVLSWSGQWLGETKVMYEDLRQGKQKFSFKNEKKLLKGIWKLLDEADIVITQNGIRFDSKKLNARFIKFKMAPPNSYEHLDVYREGKKHFAFTSHKLEYIANYLNLEYKKLSHKKFPGQELWSACMDNNDEAWKEMELYNKTDVMTLKAVYEALIPWLGDKAVDFNKYKDTPYDYECKCGSKEWYNKGTRFKGKTKYQRLKCKKCGCEIAGEKIKV